jgi:uncharacterized membrane protein
VFILSEKNLKNNNVPRFFKKILSYFTLLMGNRAIVNRSKFKEVFKNVGTQIQKGTKKVLEIGKDIIGTTVL